MIARPPSLAGWGPFSCVAQDADGNDRGNKRNRSGGDEDHRQTGDFANQPADQGTREHPYGVDGLVDAHGSGAFGLGDTADGHAHEGGADNATSPAGDDLHRFAGQATFCLLGYFFNLLPYLGVVRSTFVYHYMPALVFAQILSARVFETLTPVRYRAAAFKVVVLVVALVFVYFSPWIYALPMQQEAHARRRWLPRWD